MCSIHQVVEYSGVMAPLSDDMEIVIPVESFLYNLKCKGS